MPVSNDDVTIAGELLLLQPMACTTDAHAPCAPPLQTWVINLDRAPDRLARIAGQLDALGIAWSRFSAIDGASLTEREHSQLDVRGFCRRHGMTPVAGELGCYLSHLGVMRAFLASGARFALILEDDVQIGPALPLVVDGLQQHAEAWDMVKLSAVHSGTPWRVQAIAPGHDLAIMLTRCTGASAYLVNRHAAQVYLDRLLPMQLPYDHVFDQGWRLGLKVRMVTPTPCRHDHVSATTMDYAAAGKRKFHWSRRLPAYGYRIGVETRRVAYAVRSLLWGR